MIFLGKAFLPEGEGSPVARVNPHEYRRCLRTEIHFVDGVIPRAKIFKGFLLLLFVMVIIIIIIVVVVVIVIIVIFLSSLRVSWIVLGFGDGSRDAEFYAVGGNADDFVLGDLVGELEGLYPLIKNYGNGNK